jgi:hypothetical protein
MKGGLVVAVGVGELDHAFPTIVRYAGLVTTLVLIGFCLAGFYVEAAPGFVPAGGMILYKTVNNAARKYKEEEEQEVGAV